VSIPPAVASPPLLNAANVLTMVRLVLVPVFLVALFTGPSSGWRLTAFIIFAVACVTDRIDGEVARKYGLVTDFGRIADPIADKALIGGALFGLSILGDLTWWVTVVIAVREVGVTVLRFGVIRHGVIPASRGGKIKTLVQAIAIGLYVLPLGDGAHTVSQVIMVLAVVLTVVTGIAYVLRALRLRAAGIRVHRAAARAS
jgi:CDP-diacylglycerol--glycerol-3-phosphate 3-phosphatidyltransferase